MGDTGPTERNLNIVAHEDDDLIFFNPDVLQGIRRGAPTCTVFVTAGEYNGNETTREIYAGQRRDGMCCAYATILDAANDWTRTRGLFGGREVEFSSLTSAPDVELVFLGLPDGGDSLQPDALTRLWADSAATASSIVYPGSPVQESQDYGRADLLAVLQELMADFAPTVVRIQDTDPDPRVTADHHDHIACARFARAAVTEYATASANRLILVEHRDYSNWDYPQNLTDDVANDKGAVYQAYAAHDSAVGTGPLTWLRRQYLRWPPGVAWVSGDGQGQLHAFAVYGGAVWNWRQTSPRGTFAGPTQLDGGAAVAPALAVGVNQDGEVQVFAVDLESHDIVTSSQTAANGAFSGWKSLGNPNADNGSQTGAPAVGVNDDGRLQVFAVNSGGGVSTTYQIDNGEFSAWEDFDGGDDVQGVPVCVTRPDGRMALFAWTRTGIRRWWQTSPNGSWDTAADLTYDSVTSAPTATLHADGRLAVFWRGVGGDVRTMSETAVNGPWSPAPTSLGGPGGIGEVAAIRASGVQDRIFLVARNEEGGISATSQIEPNADFDTWIDLGGITPGTPTLVEDTFGLPAAFHIATDGTLLTTAATDGRRSTALARATIPSGLFPTLRKLRLNVARMRGAPERTSRSTTAGTTRTPHPIDPHGAVACSSVERRMVDLPARRAIITRALDAGGLSEKAALLMDVVYGTDYSARELDPSELDEYTDYDIRFLVRYIGYPDNPKCISHYPEAYQRHRDSGRVVLLVHEKDTNDVARGFDGGVTDAQVAEADRIGIDAPDNSVIFFCADRWLSGIPIETAMSYLDGAASVLGVDRVGAYGFRDFIRAAHNGGHARWKWLCGAAPTDDEVVDLGLHLYQYNNETLTINGLVADLDWSYVDPASIVGDG
jgi:LmbE family N-acetylglucosaminyl deacetylase